MFTSMIIAKFAPYLVGIIAALAGVFSVYIRGKNSGKAEAQEQAQATIDAAKAETAQANNEAVAAKTEAVQAIAAQNKQVETAKETQNVQATVNALPVDAAVAELRDEFSRDEPAASNHQGGAGANS